MISKEILEEAFGLKNEGFDENVENPPDGLKIKNNEIRESLLMEQSELFKCARQNIERASTKAIDRIAILACRAICDSLRISPTYKESASPRNMSNLIREEMDKEKIHYTITEKYIGPYLTKCSSIYHDYHKYQKRNDPKLPENTLENINKYWNELGAIFRIIFPNEENLFYQKNILEAESDENETPVEILLDDDDYYIIIEKYENCVERGYQITDSIILEKVEEAYWEKYQVKESRAIITQSIEYYDEQEMMIDKATWLKIYAERLKEKENWGDARDKYSEALEIIEKFGRDRHYAKVQNDKILCEIESVKEHDKVYKLWLQQLKTLHEIFKKYGDLKSMNQVQLNKFRIYCKLGEITKALDIIEENGENIYLSKKYEAEFYHDCANIFLKNKSLSTSKHEMEINAKRLLEKSMKMYEDGGEISGIIKILNTEIMYENNEYKRNEKEQKKDALVRVIQEIDSKSSEDIDEAYIRYLIDLGYWEGVRRLIRGDNGGEYSIWLREEGLDKKDYFKFVGDIDFFDYSLARCKACKHWSNLERGLVHLNHAIGMMRNIEKEKGVELRLFEAFVLQEQYRLNLSKYRKKYDKYSWDELKNELKESDLDNSANHKELKARVVAEKLGDKIIKKIITMWGELDSKRGVYRWKKRLAVNFLSLTNKKEEEKILKEGLEFYKGKDASKYFHYKTELISRGHQDVSRESSQEWNELFNDKYIPNNWSTKFEILNRLSYQYGTEKKYAKALETSQNVIEELKKYKQIGIQGRKNESEKAAKKREIDFLIKLNMCDEASEKAEEYHAEGTFDQGHMLDIKYKILGIDKEWEKMVNNRIEKLNILKQKDYPYQEKLQEDIARLIGEIISIWERNRPNRISSERHEIDDMRKILYKHLKKHNLKSGKSLILFAKELSQVEENKSDYKTAYKFKEDINEYISDIINAIDDRVINPRSKEYPNEKIEIEDKEQLELELNQRREQKEKDSLIKEQIQNNLDMAKMAVRIANKGKGPYEKYRWKIEASKCISRNLEIIKKGMYEGKQSEQFHEEKYKIYLKEAAEIALELAESCINKGEMTVREGMNWRRKRYHLLLKINDLPYLEKEYLEVLKLYRDLLKEMEKEYTKGNKKKVKTDMEQFVKKYSIEKRD